MWAIGKLTVREGLAIPLLLAATLLLGLAVGFAPRLIFFGLGENERILREAGLSALRLAGLIGAFAVGLPRAPGEATLLARPLTPATLILGRYVGACSVTLAMLLLLSA